jgi:hypothetical protein
MGATPWPDQRPRQYSVDRTGRRLQRHWVRVLASIRRRLVQRRKTSQAWRKSETTENVPSNLCHRKNATNKHRSSGRFVQLRWPHRALRSCSTSAYCRLGRCLRRSRRPPALATMLFASERSTATSLSTATRSVTRAARTRSMSRLVPGVARRTAT